MALGAGRLSVDTIAILTSLAKAGWGTGQVVTVLNYATVNDNGGGDFYWELGATDTPDGGTIFAPDEGGSGRWKRIYQPGRVRPEWWGASFTYDPGVGSPVDITAALQAAIDCVHTESVYAGYSEGGEVIIPKGYGYFTDEINVKDGVYLVGPGTYSGGLVWAGDNSVAHPIWIGSKDHSASFSCGLRNLQVMSLQDAATTDANLDLVYTESAQHDGGIENVIIRGGGRTCFKAETGWGGASTLRFRDVETFNSAGVGGAPDVPQVILDYPSAFIEAENIIVQGASGATVPRGLLIKSGYVHVRGFHTEEVTDGLIIEQATSPHHVTVHSATGGSNVTNVISSTSGDRTGSHLILGRILLNGATNTYKDNRAAGPTVSADIFADTAY